MVLLDRVMDRCEGVACRDHRIGDDDRLAVKVWELGVIDLDAEVLIPPGIDEPGLDIVPYLHEPITHRKACAEDGENDDVVKGMFLSLVERGIDRHLGTWHTLCYLVPHQAGEVPHPVLELVAVRLPVAEMTYLMLDGRVVLEGFNIDRQIIEKVITVVLVPLHGSHQRYLVGPVFIVTHRMHGG